MKINNFNMTKKQYDDICHILSNEPGSKHRVFITIIKYIYNISLTNDRRRVLSIQEMKNIVEKIQTKIKDGNNRNVHSTST